MQLKALKRLQVSLAERLSQSLVCGSILTHDPLLQHSCSISVAVDVLTTLIPENVAFFKGIVQILLISHPHRLFVLELLPHRLWILWRRKTVLMVANQNRLFKLRMHVVEIGCLKLHASRLDRQDIDIR